VNIDDKHGIEAFLIATGTFFALGFWILHREIAVRAWPQAKGKITKSDTLWQSIDRGNREVIPIIEYEFDYQGRLFKTSHWRIGNFSVGNSLSAEAVTSRYPVDASVTVFVNTRHLEKSVLESKLSILCWVPFTLGILFLAVSILLIVGSTKP
jgi:hypothetical protein